MGVFFIRHLTERGVILLHLGQVYWEKLGSKVIQLLTTRSERCVDKRIRDPCSTCRHPHHPTLPLHRATSNRDVCLSANRFSTIFQNSLRVSTEKGELVVVFERTSNWWTKNRNERWFVPMISSASFLREQWNVSSFVALNRNLRRNNSFHVDSVFVCSAFGLVGLNCNTDETLCHLLIYASFNDQLETRSHCMQARLTTAGTSLKY